MNRTCKKTSFSRISFVKLWGLCNWIDVPRCNHYGHQRLHVPVKLGWNELHLELFLWSLLFGMDVFCWQKKLSCSTSSAGCKNQHFLGKQIIKMVHVPLIYHVCRTISMGIRHVYAIAYIRNQLTSSWTGVKIFQHIFLGDFRSIVWMLPRPTNSD